MPLLNAQDINQLITEMNRVRWPYWRGQYNDGHIKNAIYYGFYGWPSRCYMMHMFLTGYDDDPNLDG